MRATSTLLSLLFVAASAAAGEAHLKDGKVLIGKISEDGSKICVVDRDRKYAVPKSKVLKVVEPRCFMDEYEERLAALPEEDAEAIFEFGQWLVDNDWASRARSSYEEVLEHDPDHRGARRALGYQLYEGEWVGPDELKRRKGLVYFEGDGGWYTPHDLSELKARIEQDAKLKQAYEWRRQVNDKVNEIARGFATFDKKSRADAYDNLYKYAEELNSPELRKIADDTKAYYDNLVRVLCAKMMARTEIHATHTKLKSPIETFETPLGAAIALNAGQNPVKIQLPEISVASIDTVVDIPAGCK
jgi:hypothetical protein